MRTRTALLAQDTQSILSPRTRPPQTAESLTAESIDRRLTGDVASRVMLGAVALSTAWAFSAPAAFLAPRSATRNGGTGEWRGRIVCLDDMGQRRACVSDARRFGLEGEGGEVHPFLGSDPLARMFRDPRVRQRELLVRGRLGPEGILELIKVYSIKDGTLHDLFYFCEVCNITAYEPGPCPCCRKDMELRETPVP